MIMINSSTFLLPPANSQIETFLIPNSSFLIGAPGAFLPLLCVPCVIGGSKSKISGNLEFPTPYGNLFQALDGGFDALIEQSPRMFQSLGMG